VVWSRDAAKLIAFAIDSNEVKLDAAGANVLSLDRSAEVHSDPVEKISEAALQSFVEGSALRREMTVDELQRFALPDRMLPDALRTARHMVRVELQASGTGVWVVWGPLNCARRESGGTHLTRGRGMGSREHGHQRVPSALHLWRHRIH
jgi:hypothetical protein